MENELKQRNGCISFWLYVLLISNAAMTIYYAVDMFSAYTSEYALGQGLCSILGVVSVLSVILLLRWNKIGFYMLAVSSVLAILIQICAMHMEPVLIVSSLIGVVIWWGILQIQKDGVSAWSQLQSGWDIAHCRHLYQFFAAICVILLVLTMVAFSKAGGSTEKESDDDTVVLVDDEIMTDEEVEELLSDEDAIIVDNPDKPQPTEDKSTPTPPKKSDSSEERAGDSASKQKEAEQLLKLGIEQANQECPQDTGVGAIITRIYLSGDYVMYHAECDEDLIDMDALMQNKPAMTKEIKKTLMDKSNPQSVQFVKMCVNAGKGIGFVYVGDTSGKKVSVRLTNADLKKLL